MNEGDVLQQGSDFLKVFQAGQELVQRLLRENEQLETRRKELEEQLATQEDQIGQLTQQVQAEIDQRDELLARRAELETLLSEAENRLNDSQARVDQLESSGTETVQRIEAERNELNQQLEASRSEIDALQAEMAANRSELESAKSEASNIRFELEATRAELDSRNTIVVERDRALNKSERRLAEGATQLAALSGQFDEQQRLANEHQARARELQARVAEAESLNEIITSELQTLRANIDILQTERDQFAEENEHLREALTDSERKNDSLANLYLAAFALHRSLEWSEVLQALNEILTNQLGVAVYVVSLATENTGLEVVASRGITLERLPLEGAVAEAFVSGSAVFALDEREPNEPIAALPLTTQDSTVGVLVIYELLSQKEALTKGDQELLALLSRLAATALVGARLNLQGRNGRSVLRSFLTRFRSGNREQVSSGE